MSLSKSRKRILWILGILLGVLLIAIFILNAFLANLIENRINAALQKSQSEYKLTLDDVGGNIFFGNIRLKGLQLKADSNMLRVLKAGESKTGMVIDAEVPLLRIVGVGIVKAISSGEINIRKIEIKGAKVRILKGKKAEAVGTDTILAKPKKGFDIDSIYLEGINGFSLGKIDLVNNEFVLYDVEKEEEILKNRISLFEVSNFSIAKLDTLEHVFKLDATRSKVIAKNEEFYLPDGKYRLKFKRLEFNRSDSSLLILKMNFEPRLSDKYEMARQYQYTQEVFNASVDEIQLQGIGIARLRYSGELMIDSVSVKGVDLAIFKDKRYPFNEDLRPKLPHQSLKRMELPLYIGAVNLKDSKLLYEEKEEGSEDLMTVKLGDLAADIGFITSIRDSISTGKPMTLSLSARLMEKPRLKVDFVFPLKTRADTFFFAGSLGSARLKIFNAASHPAIGVRFVEGNLKSVEFRGSANDRVSAGEMTMLYSNLKAEVEKNDGYEANKFLSWAANVVMKSDNPGKNDKVRIAAMGFERVMYKGLGNFVWKTLQSGIVGTISPVGKHVKHDEQANEKQDKSQKDENGKNRKKRKRRKNK